MTSSTQSPSLLDEARALTKLSLPLIIAQGGVTLMGAVDALIIGQVSALEMAAVSLGNGLVSMFSGIGIGLALGIEPLVGQAFGAKRFNDARSWLWQGLWVCLLISPILIALTVGAAFLLEPFGISVELADRARAYIWPRLIGVPIVFFCIATRAYLSNIGRPQAALYAAIVSNIANVILDLWFVHGWGFVPPLGAAGIAWSTTFCFLFVLLVQCLSIVNIWQKREDFGDSLDRGERPIILRLRKTFKTGWPIGLHMLAEMGVFSFVSALIARMGEVPLAAHQIAISLASVTFMGAVGIANATTARVGNFVGASSSAGARRAGFVGFGMGGSFMGVAGLSFFIFASPLAALFTKDQQVAQVATNLLRIAGVFAVADGFQVVAGGALRGAGDTKWPFMANFIGHWLIGLPIGVCSVLSLESGPAGYWWGLTAGLCFVALVLAIRFERLSAKPIQRLSLPP